MLRAALYACLVWCGPEFTLAWQLQLLPLGVLLPPALQKTQCPLSLAQTYIY